MQVSELQQYIAVTLIPGIGHVHARNLISYCGSPENVFKINRKDMLRVPGIGSIIAGWVAEHRENARKAAESEMKKNGRSRNTGRGVQ
jgi:DNA processing protein